MATRYDRCPEGLPNSNRHHSLHLAAVFDLLAGLKRPGPLSFDVARVLSHARNLNLQLASNPGTPLGLLGAAPA